ncbi:MAG: hypothetical protein AAF799_46845 [Myxococcota bacterium]
MHCLIQSNSLLLALAACAAACGPTVEGELGESDTDAVTDGVDSGSTTDPEDTVDPDSDTGSPTVGTSTGEPPPTGPCGEPGSLAELWRIDDPERDRGESVSVAEGRVAWVATTWDPATRIRVHDLDGNEQWSADALTTGGEGALRQHDIATGSVTSFVGTDRTTGTAILQIFDDAGQLQFESPGISGAVDAGGTAIGPNGDVLFGGSNDDLLVDLILSGAAGSASDSYDHGGDEHVFDATNDGADGYFVAGHSNAGGPLLARIGPDGAIEWIVESSAEGFETAHGVAADGAGGAWLSILPGKGSAGRLDHFGADGAFLEAIELDYGAVQVDVDANGNLVVLGRAFPDDPILVQRITAGGDVLAETSMDGFWGLDLATDAECHAYVSGSDEAGAFLVKLE